jgi:hypothetical protein
MTGANAHASPDSPVQRYEVLLIGNSHSAANHLPHMLESMLKLAHPGVPVKVVRAPDYGFLDEHLDNRRTRKIFDDGQWTHVVLQAQKYSTTGRYQYSTAAAQRWLRKIRERGAKSVLFPEWARESDDDEAARIHALHKEIAAKEAACVAPVGMTWQLMRAESGDLRLHAADGNHASAAGSLLTSMTLFAVINDGLPQLPVFSNIPVSAEQQKQMQATVRATLKVHPPGGC